MSPAYNAFASDDVFSRALWRSDHTWVRFFSSRQYLLHQSELKPCGPSGYDSVLIGVFCKTKESLRSHLVSFSFIMGETLISNGHISLNDRVEHWAKSAQLYLPKYPCSHSFWAKPICQGKFLFRVCLGLSEVCLWVCLYTVCVWCISGVYVCSSALYVSQTAAKRAGIDALKSCQFHWAPNPQQSSLQMQSDSTHCAPPTCHRR